MNFDVSPTFRPREISNSRATNKEKIYEDPWLQLPQEKIFLEMTNNQANEPPILAATLPQLAASLLPEQSAFAQVHLPQRPQGSTPSPRSYDSQESRTLEFDSFLEMVYQKGSLLGNEQLAAKNKPRVAQTSRTRIKTPAKASAKSQKRNFSNKKKIQSK